MSKCTHTHASGQTHDLVVEDVSVAYRRNLVLENISRTAHCGRCLALVGPNGAGKSTLLKAIAGLVKRRSGKITWSGEDNMKCRGGEFAYLPQLEEIRWDFPITVRGVVDMGRYPQLGPIRRFGKKDKEAVDAALEKMELDGELSKRQINELSGGQKQRVFLARAIAQEAHVLLLDEPFTGLDRNHIANVARLLRSLASENTLIVASHHDLNTVEEIFDDVVLLNREVIASGESSEVMSPENIDATYVQYHDLTEEKGVGA